MVQVTGIFFESKVDYTTWFGDNVEYIHGIQVQKRGMHATGSRGEHTFRPDACHDRGTWHLFLAT